MTTAQKNISADDVTLDNCALEPIHLLGEIQSFAYLLAFSTDGTLIGCSQNIEALISKPPARILGFSYTEVLPGGLQQLFEERMKSSRNPEDVERLFGVFFSSEHTSLDIAVHRIGEQWIFEFEPARNEPSVEPVYLVKNLIADLRRGPQSIEAFCNAAVKHVKKLTGFDRVMVYRFDADGSGEVVAEAAEEHLEKFLGLHYPSADIPPQARALYEKNYLRIIKDIDDIPVSIEAFEKDAPPIDLTFANIRSVSRIHIEYLKNMGVQASMSVSILSGGKLWGLFALHHYSPRLISVERRMASELFGELFSSVLTDFERKQEHQGFELIEQIINELAADDAATATPLQILAKRIPELIACDGIVIAGKNFYCTSGSTPTPNQCQMMLESLRNYSRRGLFLTNDKSVVKSFNNGVELPFAGMLSIKVNSATSLDVILFRREAISHVTWAGNPEKIYSVGPNGPRLSPRQSFASWSEELAGKSIPWSTLDIKIAKFLKASLTNFLSDY